MSENTNGGGGAFGIPATPAPPPPPPTKGASSDDGLHTYPIFYGVAPARSPGMALISQVDSGFNLALVSLTLLMTMCVMVTFKRFPSVRVSSCNSVFLYIAVIEFLVSLSRLVSSVVVFNLAQQGQRPSDNSLVCNISGVANEVSANAQGVLALFYLVILAQYEMPNKKVRTHVARPLIILTLVVCGLVASMSYWPWAAFRAAGNPEGSPFVFTRLYCFLDPSAGGYHSIFVYVSRSIAIAVASGTMIFLTWSLGYKVNMKEKQRLRRRLWLLVPLVMYFVATFANELFFSPKGRFYIKSHNDQWWAIVCDLCVTGGGLVELAIFCWMEKVVRRWKIHCSEPGFTPAEVGYVTKEAKKDFIPHYSTLTEREDVEELKHHQPSGGGEFQVPKSEGSSTHHQDKSCISGSNAPSRNASHTDLSLPVDEKSCALLLADGDLPHRSGSVIVNSRTPATSNASCTTEAALDVRHRRAAAEAEFIQTYLKKDKRDPKISIWKGEREFHEMLEQSNDHGGEELDDIPEKCCAGETRVRPMYSKGRAAADTDDYSSVYFKSTQE